MEPALFTFRHIKWAPIVQLLILCIGTFVCFVIAFNKDHVSIYLPFISENGAILPEMCIFSLVLIFGSVAGGIVVMLRSFIMTYLLADSDPRLKKMNDISTILGVISMAGLAGVAAFPMSTIMWAHIMFAVIHFLFGMFYILLQTFVNYYAPGASLVWNRVRAVLCLLLLLFLFLLVVFFPMSLFKWKKVHAHLPAMKQPKDEFFGIMFTSAFCEWSLYVTFLAFMVTYFLEFRLFRLYIGVTPIPQVMEETLG